MALTACTECGHQISTKAPACPNCGAKVSRPSILRRVLAAVAILWVGSIVVSRCATGTTPSATSSPASSTPSAAVPQHVETAAERAERERQAQEAEAAAEGLFWRYEASEEKMGKGTIYHAAVRSLNKVNFSFPYAGPQRATLLLRKHPRWGRDAVLTIEKGQLLCRLGGCAVSVSFDGEKPVRFSGNEPADHSSTAVFIVPYDRLVAGLKKAKRVSIELPVYKHGMQVFEFDVRGLDF